MKYTDQNPPLVCMMTHSTCYQGTTPMSIKGILWHSTGANNPTLKRYVQPYEGESNYNHMIELLGKNIYKNDWNHIKMSAGVNAWIGKLANGSVATVQTLPWNYKPWGCGSGIKGSCNDGWIQFEICEDALNDRAYFDEIYKEACELTAYLCKKYKINPKATVSFNGITVPTILCHNEAYKLQLGSGHVDVDHWFSKYGKTMANVRDDVAALLTPAYAATNKPQTNVPPIPEKTELYRIRKDWSDAKSQIGAYKNLTKAKLACDKAGNGYFVFNMKGEAIYPEAPKMPQVGDVIRLAENAKYTNGLSVPKWVLGSTLYLRDIRSDGNYVFSTLKTGAVTGVIDPKYVLSNTFQKYTVIINTSALNVRTAPTTTAGKLGIVSNGTQHVILDEQDGWGKIKFQGVEAWISLFYTKKV